MTTQFSVSVRNAMLDAFESTIGASPSLELRTGLKPANCAAADTGSVVATLPLPADWMAAASAGSKAIAGLWQANASASGLVGHFRIKQGATTHHQGVVGENWQGSKAYLLDQHVINDGGRLYRCTTAGTSASSGGPTGTGATIADGTAVWAYVEPSDMTLDNTNVNSGQQVTVTAFTLTGGNA